METEIIKTKDTDIVIERTYIDKTIDKKELREEKRQLQQELEDIEKTLEKLNKINIRDDFRYLIEKEIGEKNLIQTELQEKIELLNNDLLK